MARLGVGGYLDTSNHTVMEGPSMNVPRVWCASAVIGHRIFVVGGCEDGVDDVLDSVEYWNFEKPCDKGDTKEETASTTNSTVMSSLSSWTTHSELVLSVPSTLNGAVAVGSCLLVLGIYSDTQESYIIQVLNTSHRHHAWNLPYTENNGFSSTLVRIDTKVAVISEFGNPGCVTLSIVDKNSWCFRRLLEQPQRIIDQFRLGLGHGH